MVEEGEVNFVRSTNEWVTHILSGLRDPVEPCTSDTRKESPSSKGDEQSHPKEDRGHKVVMGPVEEERAIEEKLWFAVEEESAHSKKNVGITVEMQGSIPTESSPKDQSLDSNDGPIKEYVVVAATV